MIEEKYCDYVSESGKQSDLMRLIFQQKNIELQRHEINDKKKSPLRGSGFYWLTLCYKEIAATRLRVCGVYGISTKTSGLRPACRNCNF
jgi:hypothetical protein